MFHRTRVQHAVLLALTSAVVAPLPALAQEAQRIEITGSLIKRIANEAATQVVTISVEELQKSGVTNAEQAVRFITQQQGGTVTSGSVSGTNGAASFADLRALGPNRTLVLLNGKRVAPNPFAVVGTDLNTLPLAAVARIETLPDGASAIYGTDAIAGVINFITRKDYKGGSVGATVQVTEAGGGDVNSATLLGGVGDLSSQGWNVFGSLNVRQQDPMRGDQRLFSKSSYQPENGFNGTSPTSFPANYTQSVGGVNTVANANPRSPDCDPPGSISIPEANGTRIRCFADTQIYTNTVPKQDQNSLFLRGWLMLGQSNTASVEYFRAFNKVGQQIAPSPETGLTMPNTSPFYPGNGLYPAAPGLNPANNISVNWRTIVLGPRKAEQENVTQRIVAGIEGNAAGFDYQAHLIASRAEVENTYIGGWPGTQALRNGVSGCTVALTATGGCTTPLVVDGQRLYLNPFGDQTPAGLAYMQANQVLGKVQNGESNSNGIIATLSRPVFKMAGGDAIVAVNVEARKDDMEYNTDPIVRQAASSGLAGTGLRREGERDVKGVGIETVLPVIKSLELGLSLRHDRYSDFGTTTNPKVSARWQPNDSVLVRGSANRGFAAPSLYNLYLPNQTTFTSTRYNDPVLCPGGVAQPGAVAARDCGIQFQQLQGGNDQLKAEQSKAWTLGVVLAPAPNVTLGVDYWTYQIQDSISTLGEATIFGNPDKYESLFVRCSGASAELRNALGACQNPGGVDPLAYIINTNQNLGDVKTSGFDVQASANSGATKAGRFNVSYRGTYIHKYRFQVEPGGVFFNPLGEYTAQFVTGNTSGGPLIRYQHVLTFGWDMGAWSTLVSQRYLGGYRDQNSVASVAAGFRNNVVKEYSTFDLAVTYRGIKGLALTGTILNVFDQDPPFTNQTSRFQARGYDDRFHNPLGRTYQVSARYEF